MKPESELKRELAPTELVAFATTFISRWDRYSMQLPQGAYTAVKQPLTLAHIAAHIRGALTLGAYALDQESRARWICLDADVLVITGDSFRARGRQPLEQEVRLAQPAAVS
jgi:hypothetical protein